MNRQKHKLSRRILAMLLTAAMLVTMFPAAMFAAPTAETNPVETTEPGPTSKSKTATELSLAENGKYQSEVTLSLPAADEKLASDIVFVIDKSSSSKEASTEQGLEMLEKLPTDAEINFGAIVFDGAAYVAYDLQKFDANNLESISEAIDSKPGEEAIGGTNIDAGLTAAKSMLENANDGVADSRKYVILISDGLTRLFTGEDGKTKIIFNEQYADSKNLFGDFTTWCLANGFKDGEYKVPGGDWDDYFEKISKFVETDKDQYVVNYQKDTSTMSPDNPNAPENYISYDKRTEHALCIDRSIYEAFEAYQALSAYNCYAVYTGNSELGQTIMSELNGGQEIVDFDSIGRDINYLLDDGSYVIDEIGFGTDNHNNEYDFDFVQSDNLILTVGTEALTADRVTEGLPEGETAQYTFGEDSDRFVLHYYQNGTTAPDKKSHNECFVWEINEPVSQFAPVQLTYTVELQQAQTAAGTYGSYEADGQDDTTGAYLEDEGRSLFTNNVAVLYAKETEATEVGEPEYFAKPTVSYTVEEQVPEDAIAIRPADITIYTGGNGYDSVVNGSGDEIGLTNNGLPTPGFYIDMSDAMNEWLLKKVNSEDITTNDDGKQVIDLSGYLTFTYNKDTVTRTWSLERYDNKQDNTSMAYSQYIYRITPGVSDDGTETPIRLQFTDDKGAFMTSDDFSVGLNELFHQYDMSIYPGDLEQKLVKAVLTIGEETYELESEVEKGKLVVRGVTDNNTATTDVIDAAPTGEVENITAQVPANTKFYINESKLEVVDATKVSLLVDSIVPDGNNTLLNKAVTGFDEITSNHKYQLNYLDLVDTSNGNAWVTADKPITVYWPYPEGTTMETNFQIVHYDDLDRDDNDALTGNDFTMTRYSADSQNTNVLENTPQGIKITVNSFSPFALFWEEADDDNPPYIPPTTGDDDDDEEEPDTPALDKVNHFLYVEGYPEDYRTGEYSDNEDLWPVKPQGNITRAEVATIFYRLLKDEVREEIETDVNSFPDVNEDDWFNITVSSLANMGAISGYEDGTFRPNEPISRAELAAMAVRFYDAFEAEYEEGTFLDVDGDEWYADAIAAAEELGILGGYPDGTVRPNNNITRAETCAIVNRVLERRPHDEHLGDVDDMRTWPDNLPGAWYYADMQEATNGHYYKWIDIDDVDFEEWTEVDKDYDWTKR